MRTIEGFSLDLTSLQQQYDRGSITVRQVIEMILADLDKRGADGVWISAAPAERLFAAAERLQQLVTGGAALLQAFGGGK